MMKRIVFYILLPLTLVGVKAQSLKLAIDQFREDTLLVVDIFIEKGEGDDFQLGSASFPFSDVSNSLDLKNAVKDSFFDGIFSNTISPNSYSDFYLSAKSDYLHLVLLKNFTNESVGQLVTNQRTRIARIKIPVIDKCGTAGLFWLTNAGTSIATFADVDITDAVNYVGPTAYRLTPELVVPIIKREGEQLYVLEDADTYVWSVNGTGITADTSRVLITEEGDYLVEIENDCERKSSEVYKVESITAIDDISGLAMSVTAFPNPYSSQTIIQYSLNKSANVSVEVFDLIGNKLVSLVEEGQASGVYNYPFSAAEKGYKSGVYIVKVSANDVVITQRIVELGR